MAYLKIDTQKGQLETMGNVIDIATLACETIAALHDSLKFHGRHAEAEVFRAAVTAALTDSNSPVFSGAIETCEGSVLIEVDKVNRRRSRGE